MSFLSVFKTIGHAVEAAAGIAAPIIATVNPVVGGLMGMANNAAISVEAAITTPNSGAQKNQVVAQSLQSTVDTINAILKDTGKAALPENTVAVVLQQLETVIAGLNATSKAVAPAA